MSYSDLDPAFLKNLDPDPDPEVKNATFLYLSRHCNLFWTADTVDFFWEKSDKISFFHRYFFPS